MPRLRVADRLRLRGEVTYKDLHDDGFVAGPTDATRRSVSSPRSWAGLAGNDAELLGVFLDQVGADPLELHTGVPVGRVPTIADSETSERDRKMIAACWPRRIDACVRWPEGWWIVECKPDANHYAIGQLLCYYFWWCRDVVEDAPVRTVIVTDVCDPDVKPVAECLGLVIAEVGQQPFLSPAAASRRRSSLSPR